MVKPTKAARKRCGQVFILDNDIFSFICEFCEDEFHALDDFRAHLIDHFSVSPTIIKIEDEDDLKNSLIGALQGDDGSQSSQTDEDSRLLIIKDEGNIKSVEDVVESDDENVKMTEMNKRRNVKLLAAANVSHRFLCDICQWSTTRKSVIRQHMRSIHTNERPYQCKVCSTSFSLKTILSQHLRTHTGEKTFKCELCDMSFGYKRDLNRHMNTHTGEKPYKCDLCGKRFSQNLIRHMLTHTGEKPFQCDLCSRSFAKKHDLGRHMQTHTGEKPHKCNVCSKRFSQMTSLNAHMRTHTGERPFKCTICKTKYTCNSHLRRHMQTHTK